MCLPPGHEKSLVGYCVVQGAFGLGIAICPSNLQFRSQFVSFELISLFGDGNAVSN